MATATIYGANYTVAKNVTPATYLKASQWGGKVRCHRDVAKASAASDAGSLIYIGTLPKGCIPIGVTLASDTTNAITGTVGWSGDTDALGTFKTLAASLTTGLVQRTMPTVYNTPLTEDKDVYITTAAAALESGKIVISDLMYMVE